MHDKKLRILSSKTLNNSCSTRDGIRYKAKGSRMSGDVDTSLGNSLINYAIIKEVLYQLGIEGDAIVNGDDSIIFTNEPIPQDKAKKIFQTLNQETKIQVTQTNIHKVEFCRTKYVINNLGQPTMMINLDRLTDIFGMTYKNTGDYMEYCRQVIACNIACNSANPLYTVWKDIYEQTYGALSTAKLYQAMLAILEKKHKMIAIKNLTTTPDTGEFNVTMYQTHGNLDRLYINKDRIIRKLSRIKSLGKIGMEALKTAPLANVIMINHQAQTI